MAAAVSVLRRVRGMDVRKPLAVGLAALAALLVLVLTQPPASVSVLVAARDLSAGAPLSPGDVTVRHFDHGDGLVRGSTLGELEGWSLVVPIAAGEPLLGSLVQPPQVAATGRLMSLAVEASAAALGTITAGDEIDIYVTVVGAPGEAPVTELLASQVYVQQTMTLDNGVGSATVELLLAVDDALAPRLAAAIRSGDIDLVKRTG